MNEIIRMKFSPYTYARVSAMKSLLLKKEDYDRLVKMGYNEILGFLQESKYRKEINEFDLSKKGPNVIEAALNANLMRTFMQLHRISNKSTRKVIENYLLRYDMENAKAIIRSKFTGGDFEELEMLLYPSINFSKEFMADLISKENVDDILKALPFKQLKNINTSKLFDIENALDNYYLETMYTFAKKLPGKGKVIADFLMQEIDTVNIRTILRLKDEPQQQVEKYLIYPSRLVRNVLAQDSLSKKVDLLKEKKRVSLKGDEKDLLMRLDIDLDVNLLRKEALLMHKYVLSPNQILGFLFAKDIEVKNLKTLIKGKQLGISQDYLSQLLVIAS